MDVLDPAQVGAGNATGSGFRTLIKLMESRNGDGPTEERSMSEGLVMRLRPCGVVTARAGLCWRNAAVGIGQSRPMIRRCVRKPLLGCQR
jgi:hypothetical protein